MYNLACLFRNSTTSQARRKKRALRICKMTMEARRKKIMARCTNSKKMRFRME